MSVSGTGVDRFAGRSIRFGIIGCGAIGPTHAAALSAIDGATVGAVADTNPSRADDTAKKFGVEKTYPSADQLLADPAIDAVCVCTPSGRHADHAVAALMAGKHVVIEKPMDVTTAACDRIIAAAAAANKVATVISQHRFDPASTRVKKWIDDGRLGRIFLATADVKWYRTQAYYDEGDWRGSWDLDGGGAVMNQGVHTVDLLLWLLGPAVSIRAHAATAAHDRIAVEDAAAAVVKFASGAIGTFVATTAAYDGLPVRIDLFGTEGSVVLEGDRLKSAAFRTGEVVDTEDPAAHAVGVARGGTAGASTAVGSAATWGDSHRAQLADFCHAIRTGTPPAIDLNSSRAAVAFVRDLYAAAGIGGPG